jgi:hypothetical protein
MRKLLLKTVNADMTAHGGFVWPRSGEVRAEKWNPKPVCGGGLHGALHGCGNGSLFNWSEDAVWIVFEAIGKVVEFGGKAKCSAGNVLYAGDQKTATDMILAECGPVPCIGAFIIGGDGATVSGGYRATVSGGDGATVIGGDWATVSGGDVATVSGGDGATVSGGDWATVSGGYRATVSGGDGATVSGGYRATVSGGDGATVSGGDSATVSGGDWATVSGGDVATVSGGDWATVSGGDWATVSGGDGATVSGGDVANLSVKWLDGNRYRIAVAYVGEDGIKPNVKYRCEKGAFVVAK